MSTLIELPSFHFSFQISRVVIFEVRYYRLGSNTHKYFAPSACKFNRPKTDYVQCGQAQKDLLSGPAMSFFKKWDKCHAKDICTHDHASILADIEKLKTAYNYVQSDNDIPFSFNRALSMKSIKRTIKATLTNI
jgi:hypothetical protein